MKRFVAVLLMGIAVNAFAADTVVKGYLVDTACAKDDGKKPGFGAKHSRGCLQMDDCARKDVHRALRGA